MSWYQKDLGAKGELPINVTITDMHTEKDMEKLTKTLLELDGVTNVRGMLAQKRLTVHLDPAKTSLATLVFTIANLGYHYIQRG